MNQLNEMDYGTPARESEKCLTIEVDGVEVTVAAGTSVMRAATEAGVNVPKLCATDSLEPFGYGLKQMLGESAGTQTFDSVMKADVIMIIGANPASAHRARDQQRAVFRRGHPCRHGGHAGAAAHAAADGRHARGRGWRRTAASRWCARISAGTTRSTR